MDKTSFFEFNQPEYTDPVDIVKLNANMDKIDSALFAGLCKKKVTANSIGDGTQVGSPKGWAPFFEIKNTNESAVTVTNRNFESVTYTIPAGETHREYFSGLYPMNFIAADDKEVEYSYFVDAETRINEIQPSGGGGVTSVTVNTQNNSHLTTSGSPIVDSGTITIGVSSGYEIPETSKQTEWNGKAADLKAEINSSTYVMTLQLKDSSGNLIGSEKTIDLPLETMVVDGEYDSQTKKIKLELKNGNYVEFSVADLVSGLQSELNSNNKLNPAYIAYDSTHRAVSDTEKSTWNGKQNALTTAQTQAVNSGITSEKVTQISTNETNILHAVDNGVKNQFPINGMTPGSTITNHGVTLTYNEDGTFTLNGTATGGAATFILADIPASQNDGNVFKNCILKGGYSSNVYIAAEDWSATTQNRSYNNTTAVDITIPANVRVAVYIRVSGNTQTQNTVIYPFICDKTIYTADSSFAKPALSNAELTQRTASSQLYTKSPSGNVSSASLDLSDLPTGGYLMYVVNNESGTNRYGCSVYTLGKYDSGTPYVCTPVYEKTNSKMSSYTFSSDVMDITFDKSGYKTIKFVRQY